MQREQMILDSAVECFGRLGYAGASLSAIGRNSGVSKALVLQHFGSKEDLYIACVDRAGDNLSTRIEVVLSRDGRPLDTAADTLDCIFGGLEARPHDWNVLHDRTMPRGSAAHLAARRHRELITAQGARGVAALAPGTSTLDDDDLALLTAVWTHTVTAVVHWWLRNPTHSAAEMSQRCRRLLATLSQMQ